MMSHETVALRRRRPRSTDIEEWYRNWRRNRSSERARIRRRKPIFSHFGRADMLFIVTVLMLISLPAVARDTGQWGGQPTYLRQWFQKLMQPNNPHMSCCSEPDAFEADSFEVRGDQYVAIITNGNRVATRVQPQQTEQGEAVFCDTQVQIEQFAAYSESRPISEALEQVNRAAPNACAPLLAAFIRGEQVKAVRINQGTVHLYEVLVVGVWIGQWGKVDPKIQYIAVLDNEEDA
jgi:hypothetical protein